MRVFNATNSNTIISKIKKKILDFFLNVRNLHKIWNALKKKDEPQSLFVSEIIDLKKWGYLNA